MDNLKEYFHQIEHLTYEQRKPEHATLFANKALLSKLIWDIYSHNACLFYHKKNAPLQKSILSERGFVTGRLSIEETALLKKIFHSCEQLEFDPNDFDSDYFYEPRQAVHESMRHINTYYYPSEFLFSHLPKLIQPLIQTIEQECGFYWKVASMRIFKVNPVSHTQGMHKDDQPFAIKKIFFYPNGVSKALGSTQIETKKGELIVVDGEPGTWLLFENSLASHQAFSSLTSPGRPTIEVDIMPAFETDPTLIYAGVNSWHPWFPLDPRNSSTHLNTPELNFENVYQRNLQRIAGLCTLNKADQYQYPVDLKDIETDHKLFDAVKPLARSLRHYFSFRRLISVAARLKRLCMRILSKIRSWNTLLNRPYKKTHFWLVEEESRLLSLIKNFYGFPSGLHLIHSKEAIDPRKIYFVPLRIPQMESIAQPEIIAKTSLIEALNSHPNVYLLYDLSTEPIIFSGFVSDLLIKFHDILNEFHIDHRRVYLLSSNANVEAAYQTWVAQHHIKNPIRLFGYHFYLYEYWWEIEKSEWFAKHRDVVFQKSQETVLNNVRRSKHFLCLNLRPRVHRTAVVLHLLERGHFEKGRVTYFGEEFGYNDHQSVEDLAGAVSFIRRLQNPERLLALLPKLQAMAPIQYERNAAEMRKDLWVRRPGEVDYLIPEAAQIESQGIDTYFEIVNETWFTDTSNLYITEKTIRAIVRLQPFIHVGAPFVLKTLRSLGFKTFSPYIDESYDEIIDPPQRMEALFKEIDRLCGMSLEEIHQLYCNLWPVLVHNYQLYHHEFRRLSKSAFPSKILEKLNSQ